MEDEAGEAALIEAAKEDPARFAVLYEDHFDAVYAYVARRSSSRQDAEDMTSIVFQRALAALPKFEWQGVPFRAWLLRIASNELARRRPALSELVVDDVAVDDRNFDKADSDAVILGLLRLLPNAQRQVLSLRFEHDQPIQEVARALGKSEGAIKQLQYRALDTLRRQQGAR